MANEMGKAIRERRRAKGWGLGRLASEAGISVAYLSDIERGNRNGSEEVIASIALDLDMLADDLLAMSGRLDEVTAVYVREHPHGLLPGLPNLYCLDGALRLQWLAEWPLPGDPCAAIARVEGDTLTAISAGGVEVRLAAANGRLLGCAAPVAAAG